MRGAQKASYLYPKNAPENFIGFHDRQDLLRMGLKNHVKSFLIFQFIPIGHVLTGKFQTDQISAAGVHFRVEVSYDPIPGAGPSPRFGCHLRGERTTHPEPLSQLFLDLLESAG